MKLFIKILVGVVLLTVVVIGGAVFYVTTQFDPNAYKTQIAEKLSQTLGRKVALNGPIALTVFPNIKLSLQDAVIGNADWAGTAPMAQVKTLDASLALMPLLQKELVIEGVKLDSAALNLVQSGDKNNWTFNHASSAEAAARATQTTPNAPPLALQILALTIHDSTLNFTSGGKTTAVKIVDAKTSLVPSEAVGFVAQGTINGTPYQVTLKGDTLSALLNRTKSWPVTGAVKFANANMTFNGAVEPPQTLALSSLDFSMGQTKASGKIKILLTEKPTITGDVTIPTLNLADFAAPTAPTRSSALPIIGTANAAPMQSDALIPAIPLPTAALRAVNADVKLHIGQIVQGEQRIASFDGDIHLNDGNLQIASIQLTYGSNNFTGDANLNGRGDPAALALNLNSPQLDYGKLLQEMKLNNGIHGTGAMTLTLAGSGSDLRQVMANSRGQFHLISSNGEFNTGMLLGGVGNLLNAVQAHANIPETAQLKCADFTFAGQNGVWQATQSAADSNVMALAMTGNVNLVTEQLSLKTLSTLKTGKTGTALPPLKIAGALNHPTVTTDGANLAQTAIAAGSLAKIKGLDVLTGFISPQKRDAALTGPAGNPCMAAVQQAAAGSAPKSSTVSPTAGAAQTPTQPAAKQNLSNLLNNGLKGLLGK